LVGGIINLLFRALFEGVTDPGFHLSIYRLLIKYQTVNNASLLPISNSHGLQARLTRSSILEVIRQDYIRTAWAKGLRERVIVIRHVLKNGMIPVITLIGLQVSGIFGGSVLVETVFNIPGMGRLIVSSVFAQDYPVIQGCSLIFAFVVVMVNLLVDISYGWLDPRIRYG